MNVRAIAVVAALFLAPTTFGSNAFAQARGDRDRNERDEELTLAVGETKTLSARDIKNYSEGQPGIADIRVTPDGNQFVIAGKRPGTTTLLLIRNNGTQSNINITVSTRSMAAVEKELQQLTDGMSGVRVRRVGARFFIEGSVVSDAELRKIQQFVALYPGQVESVVSLGAGGGDRRILIRLDFFFVQYERTSSYAVGLGWPAAIGGTTAGGTAVLQSQVTYDFVAKTTTTAQASIINQPLPSLDIASRNGWAKVMKQSSLITSNGLEASFESGGEQNIITNTGLTVGLARINFGTNVTVLPRYDAQSREMDIRISTDVSDLFSTGASQPPGRTVSRLNTQVVLKLGQALVLSGLRSQNRNHDVSGLPILSEIPVLGLLFGSHKNSQSDIENAMLIIPSVVETVPEASRTLVRNALTQFKKYDGDIENVEAFDKAPPVTKSRP